MALSDSAALKHTFSPLLLGYRSPLQLSAQKTHYILLFLRNSCAGVRNFDQMPIILLITSSESFSLKRGVDLTLSDTAALKHTFSPLMLCYRTPVTLSARKTHYMLLFLRNSCARVRNFDQMPIILLIASSESFSLKSGGGLGAIGLSCP